MTLFDLIPFVKSEKFRGRHIHLGVSGSVACYKACDLLRAWLKMGIHVSATLSGGARQFLSPLLFRALGAMPVYGEMFEDSDDVFAHLEPGQISQALIVAPASAEMLASLAHGRAHTMLAAQALAFRGKKVAAPAMNPLMWENRATQANIDALGNFGWDIINPESGIMADGDTGTGRLANPAEIFLRALKALSPQDMAGIRVMVTLGPTREHWDAARYWSNASTGAMGCALATAAWLRGATVTAICGPGVRIFLPVAIRRINVESAGEMAEAAKALWPEMNMGLFCAAVSDYFPLHAPGRDIKFKKDQISGTLEVELGPTEDILATLAQLGRDDQKILGFAAEAVPDMPDLLSYARKKLKKADIIAANRINVHDTAFGAEAMPVAVADKNGREEIWSVQPKADIAWELCSWLLTI